MKIKLLIMFIFAINTLLTASIVYASGNYVALGDSITTGYGLSDKDSGFAEIIAENAGYTLKNYAKNGATSNDVLNLLKSGEIDEDIKSAELITLTCGGNDMIHTLYREIGTAYTESTGLNIDSSSIPKMLEDSDGLMLMTTLSVLTGDGEIPFYDSLAFANTLSDYEKNLEAILSYIKNLNPKARIAIATQYNPYKNATGVFGEIGKIFNLGVKKLNTTINDTSKKVGAEVCDVYANFEASSDNLCNADFENLNLDIHPNANGHKIIAETITGTKITIPSQTINKEPTVSKTQKPIGPDIVIKSAITSAFLILSL